LLLRRPETPAERIDAAGTVIVLVGMVGGGLYYPFHHDFPWWGSALAVTGLIMIFIAWLKGSKWWA
jgi:hypothetical protein